MLQIYRFILSYYFKQVLLAMGAGATKIEKNTKSRKQKKQSNGNGIGPASGEPRVVLLASLKTDNGQDQQPEVHITKPQMTVGHLTNEDYVTPDGRLHQHVHQQSPPVTNIRTSVAFSINGHSTQDRRSSLPPRHSQPASLPEVSS